MKKSKLPINNPRDTIADMTHVLKNKFNLRLLVALTLVVCESAHAEVIQIEAGLSTGHFIDGFNATDEHPIVSLGADISFENGAFGGAQCYESSSGEGGALPRGCHFYAGYFTPINDTQALSFELRHKNYLVESDVFWQYFEASVDWSINQQFNLGFTVTDDWLDRETTAYSVRLDYTKPLSKLLNAYVSASVMKFSGVDVVNFAEHFEVGLRYQKNRWAAGLSFISSDNDVLRLPDFDVSRNQLKLEVSYRLY